MCKRFTLTQFVDRAAPVHGDRYDYADVINVNSHTPVVIKCREHGPFKQKPMHHFRGNGCPQCGKEAGRRKKTKGTADFLKESASTHGDRYDYSRVLYQKAKTPVIIICRLHGEFNQQPQHHVAGRGCPRCGKYGFDQSRRAFLYTLYCESAGIIKIGITNHLRQRMRQLRKNTPFAFTVSSVVRLLGNDALKRETVLKRSLKSAGLTDFDGATEWFLIGNFPE